MKSVTALIMSTVLTLAVGCNQDPPSSIGVAETIEVTAYDILDRNGEKMWKMDIGQFGKIYGADLCLIRPDNSILWDGGYRHHYTDALNLSDGSYIVKVCCKKNGNDLTIWYRLGAGSSEIELEDMIDGKVWTTLGTPRRHGDFLHLAADISTISAGGSPFRSSKDATVLAIRMNLSPKPTGDLPKARGTDAGATSRAP